MRVDVNKLKEIPVLEIASQLGMRTIRNKAMCFNDHDRKTPSLSFDQRKNFWYCFGCGMGGDGIRLVQKYLNLDFKEACSWLVDRFQPHNFENIHLKRERRIASTAGSGFEPTEDSYQADTELFEWLINSISLSERSREYLMNVRHFSHNTLEYFNIKDLDRPYETFNLARKRWGLKRLMKSGLIRGGEKGKLTFIWWDQVILFPFYDLQDRVIYIQGRRLGSGDPRYVNLVGLKTELFNWRVLKYLKQNDCIYICEGVTDVLSAYEVGINAVGVIGANNFKEEWANRFKDFRVRVIPDVDSAGLRLCAGIRGAFRKIGKSVEIVKLGRGKDLSEFIQLV